MTSQPRRVLIFGINYSPEMTGIAPYTTELANHFVSVGHSVSVVTGLPHYPGWRRLPIPAGGATSNPMVLRYRHFIPRRANALGRALYEATWLLSATRAFSRQDPTLVIGIIPSLSGGLLAVFGGRLWRVPVGLIVQDLMGPAAAQSGYRGGGVVAGITRRVEAAVVRRADRVAIVSDGFRGYLHGAGVHASRIHRVRNWTRPGSPSESRSASRKRLGWNPSDFVCLHAGNMGQKQGLDVVLDAARLLRSGDIKIVLAGDGNDRARLEGRVARQNIRNVSLLGVQPPGLYEAMLGAADALILSQRASVVDMSLPSKLTSYFAAGRPVVAAVAPSSQTADDIDSAGAGILVEPGNPAALADALESLSRSPSTADLLGSRGLEYAHEHLIRASCFDAYDEFVDQLCESAATSDVAILASGNDRVSHK